MRTVIDRIDGTKLLESTRGCYDITDFSGFIAKIFSLSYKDFA